MTEGSDPTPQDERCYCAAHVHNGHPTDGALDALRAESPEVGPDRHEHRFVPYPARPGFANSLPSYRRIYCEGCGETRKLDGEVPNGR